MRKTIETVRESMEMKDPYWESYTIEGRRLEDILNDPNKPSLKDHPGKCIVWSKDKGWEAVNVKDKI